MKIYTEIVHKPNKMKPELKGFQVINTAREFWHSLKEDIARAKIVDASSLMPFFVKTDNFDRTYQRNIVFEDLSPIGDSLWVEVEDEDSGTSLGALLTYTEVGDDPDIIMEAAEYGIRGPFRWRCESYSFIKQPLCRVMPLNWCLIEYIKTDGTSAGSLLKPIELPEGIYKDIHVEMEHMRLFNHGIATLISDLGFYLIEALHHDKAVLENPAAGEFFVAMPAI